MQQAFPFVFQYALWLGPLHQFQLVLFAYDAPADLSPVLIINYLLCNLFRILINILNIPSFRCLLDFALANLSKILREILV